MANYKAEYLRYMDEKGIKYRDRNETVVSVGYSADNMKSVDVIVEFDKEGKNLVTFHSWSIGKFADDAKYSRALVVCNEMNKKFRWVKFYLDNDRDVTVQADAIVDIETVGRECAELVSRIVNISDEAYPEFMRVLWG